jgi:hypothetical protein
MELGQLYRSSEVIGAGQDLPHARTPEAWAGQPGVRAPHPWIIYQGETISTIDLFTGGFVLLSSNPAWREPAKEASDRVWGFHTGRHRRRRCPVPECGRVRTLIRSSERRRIAGPARRRGLLAYRANTPPGCLLASSAISCPLAQPTYRKRWQKSL